MKLHHLRTAFLVICLLLVCSQGRSQINTDGGIILSDDTTAISGTSGIGPSQQVQAIPVWGSDFINPINNNDTPNFTNNIITNTDPAVPEPTTLSLLAMSLLFAGRRWR